MKKGQMSGTGWAIVSLFLVLTILAVLQQVALLTVSKVSANVALPVDLTRRVNESVTITSTHPADDNSTLLAQDGYITNSETVRNATAPFVLLNRGTEYVIRTIGASGALTATANFTLLNVTNVTSGVEGFNNTGLFVTYQTNEATKYQTSLDQLEDDNLDTFELGGTAQIVLAASIILVSVVGLIVAFKGRG